VTPLRDGMNLVAKEYVASQDQDDPGVLILSRFIGAAIALRRALLVNPYDAESVAGALARALAMPLKERRARHEALFAAICEHDVDRWQREFLAAVRGDNHRDYNPTCNTLGYSDSSTYQKDEKMLSSAETPRFAILQSAGS
jgi:trehalose 6-phosphate synthase